MTQTPRQLGYRMPAEWEPHEATLARLAAQSRRLAGKIPGHPLALCRDRSPAVRARTRAHPRQRCPSRTARRSILERAGAHLDRVSFDRWPTDRVWTRDSGPIFVRNSAGQVAVTNWRIQCLGQILQLDSSTTRFPAASPMRFLCFTEWQPDGARSTKGAGNVGGWCLKAAPLM